MSRYLRGSVNRIVSRTRLLLTLDEESRTKAEAGMVFVVYEDGPHVKAWNGESLGRLEIQKARVVLVHVQPEFCYADGVHEKVPKSFLMGLGYDPINYEWVQRPIAAPPEATQGSMTEGEKGPDGDAAFDDVHKSRNRMVAEGDRVRSLAPVD